MCEIFRSNNALLHIHLAEVVSPLAAFAINLTKQSSFSAACLVSKTIQNKYPLILRVKTIKANKNDQNLEYICFTEGHELRREMGQKAKIIALGESLLKIIACTLKSVL